MPMLIEVIQKINCNFKFQVEFKRIERVSRISLKSFQEIIFILSPLAESIFTKAINKKRNDLILDNFSFFWEGKEK
jgi:hypothetical protein